MARHIANRDERLKKKVRSKIIGKTTLPRLSVHKTNKHIYAQAIDDTKKVTIAGMSDAKMEKMTKLEKAKKLGLELAVMLKKEKVTQVVFDRGSFKYIGRVQAIADGLREGGITI